MRAVSPQTLAVLFSICAYVAALEHRPEVQQTKQSWRWESQASLNKNYSGWVSVNGSMMYVFRWPSSSKLAPFRLSLAIPNAQWHSWPLTAIAKQGRYVLPLTLPLLFVQHSFSGSGGPRDTVATAQYFSLARTLCPADGINPGSSHDGTGLANEAFVELSTSSTQPINFTISATLVEDFELVASTSPQLVELQPSKPQYYWFNFSDNAAALGGARSVRVLALSERHHNDSQVCTILAVQRSRCPVWDTPETVDHTGLYQTVLSSGYITVSREDYPAFFIVLMSYPSDGMCRGSFETNPALIGLPFYNFTKRITLQVTAAPEPNAVLTGTGIIILALMLSITALAVCVFRRRRQQEVQQQAVEDFDVEPPFDSMSVAVLNRMPTDRHAYWLQLCVISAFYCLPALQLMLVLSNVIYKSGDLDRCFYNFACSVKLSITTDVEIYAFNNVFSNIGYLAAGVTFILVCAVKKHYSGSNCQTGVPVCYSLYYACGAAVAMEGVMSATYHLCPSYYNFQYDTAFMLMIAGLLILLLYSKRHPDANATAQIAYLALGAFILANTLGILFGQSAASIVYPVLATLHLLLTAKLACQLYYLGQVSSLRDIFSRTGPRDFPYPPDSGACGSGCFARQRCCQPRYPKTLAFLVVSVTLNLASIGLYVANGFGKLQDVIPTSLKFADVFLAVMIMNFLLYLVFYLLMKACSARRSEWRCVCLVVLLMLAAAALSASALYFFQNAPTDWMTSPAGSRDHNAECIVGNEFDKHDLWHFLSAGALFCVLMLIFCVDANDSGKMRYELPVF